MKNIFKKYLIASILGLFLFSCENDELKTVMKSNATPGLSLSSNTATLSKDTPDANAVTVNWTKPEYGYSAAVSYRLLVDKAGNNFKTAQSFSTGNTTTYGWTNKQLNGLLAGMGFKPQETANLEFMVESILSADLIQKSEVKKFTTAAYLDRLDLSSPWGLVGSAAPNGWDGPDVPFYKTLSSTGVFVCYAKLTDGDIKIRENNQWSVNYGDNGNDGTLEINGANITVKAGSYKVTFDSNKLLVKVEKFSWGIVGSAAPNGWNGPDLDFFYDPATDQFRALGNFTDGDIKIRKNNDWSINYGDTGNNGSLELNGDNIPVKKGVYLITFNPNTLEIKIEKTSIPGIVGPATPNGWDGPDVQFVPNFFKDTGVWVANGVKLKAGDMKFRMNNDWSINYGDDGNDLSLEINGANINVPTAGTYDIELNLINTLKPTYTVKKK